MIYFTVLASVITFTVVSGVPLYGQCGGEGFRGSTQCDSGFQCLRRSKWFSSCQKSCPAGWECANTGQNGAATAAKPWDQCGGQGWNGAKSCMDGYNCYARSIWYSQCRPDCPSDWICFNSIKPTATIPTVKTTITIIGASTTTPKDDSFEIATSTTSTAELNTSTSNELFPTINPETSEEAVGEKSGEEGGEKSGEEGGEKSGEEGGEKSGEEGGEKSGEEGREEDSEEGWEEGWEEFGWDDEEEDDYFNDADGFYDEYDSEYDAEVSEEVIYNEEGEEIDFDAMIFDSSDEKDIGGTGLSAEFDDEEEEEEQDFHERYRRSANNRLTVTQLKQIMPKCAHPEYIDFINKAMEEGRIQTCYDRAAFLAQIAHESGQLNNFLEKASGKAYEFNKQLGNTQPGDGVKYKGRGALQITGRWNYEAAGKQLKLDIANNPNLVLQPEIAFRTSVWFWKIRKLSKHANLGTEAGFKTVTKRINNAMKNYEDRRKYWKKALQVLKCEGEANEEIEETEGETNKRTCESEGGICQHIDQCTDGYNVKNLCPGGTNIQCCIKNSPTNKRTCEDEGGVCEHVDQCSDGHNLKNLCPGGTNVQCCIRDSLTTNPSETTEVETSSPVCSVNGDEGRCISTTKDKCNGQFFSGYCKGLPNDIKCCIESEYGACSYDNVPGLCKDKSTCTTGNLIAGECPGTANNIQCCLQRSLSKAPPARSDACDGYEKAETIRLEGSYSNKKTKTPGYYNVAKIQPKHLSTPIWAKGTYKEHDIMIDPRTACAFVRMHEAAKKAGYNLKINSGFRTFQRQIYFYRILPRGKAAVPGTSNHGYGKALDLNAVCKLKDAYKQKPHWPPCEGHALYKWLIKNSESFGFRRTVSHESWHFDYVGF